MRKVFDENLVRVVDEKEGEQDKGPKQTAVSLIHTTQHNQSFKYQPIYPYIGRDTDILSKMI